MEKTFSTWISNFFYLNPALSAHESVPLLYTVTLMDVRVRPVITATLAPCKHFSTSCQP